MNRIVTGNLGPDPGQEVTQALGLAAFQLLIATLCMTPMQRWTRWGGWIRVRRMLGLFAFFYACLHVLSFLQFILGWHDLWATFTKRPYIIAGSVAFLVLVPLALTSTKGMMRRLGSDWKRLHRLIYVSVVAAWIHFIWQARSDVGEMLIYGVLVAGLLWLRARWIGWNVLIPFVREQRSIK
ncbi:protein-methionine-sulfoxide reductase heme-binding subunit MsrQ [Marinobacter sp. chi1]|uniref:Protein-methionine-sulfoxide reductase heme-binding subunit MsrQ n=1 Tax=Marinobacter suaedae TaxID=3057675 RepID=A0ABT8W4Z8_9GAMM|nr:protein-methionine-sulfoxide reductase heme-binding subunit MsrQ [Marinobacter sp. chi1]MDO3723300.1 protein-methionine-sulfoxide reductase heme-binding subunit MsrQ [Marinobacter sp. chi1]